MPSVYYWNNRQIRCNNNRLINLPDLANATNQSAEKFLNKKRTLEIICYFYKEQTGQIKHPIIEIDKEIWIEWFLACEFSYQHPDKRFTLWFNRILWGDFSHPEVKSEFEERFLFQKRSEEAVKEARRKLFPGEL